MMTTREQLSPQLEALLEKSRLLEKWPLARLISIFEGTHSQQRKERHQIVRYLDQYRSLFPKTAYIVGFTGSPGSGKSSLIGELCLHLLKSYSEFSVAVIAVDPSSHLSGGSLLGDRTRVNFPIQEKRMFFRSQASNLELGGVSRQTFQVTRLLRFFFDFIFIETVGIGQSEIEIQKVSDHTCLVLQPLTGDQIQFMKCGIMEIPDTFIINKCDEEALAKKSYHLLESSLKNAKISVKTSNIQDPIFLTSATKQRGIDPLVRYLIQLAETEKTAVTQQRKETFYLEKWVRDEFGRWGMSLYHKMRQEKPQAFEVITYEDQEELVKTYIEQQIKTPL
ncbi:protein kinase [Deltaproteobacteria bacterium TL4]